jgi:D-tyrosyl-tRNA(Tyr) deacylase
MQQQWRRSGKRKDIYAAAVEALREKERQDETQFTTRIGGKHF